ncbi:filamentous hemagglutinin N-terminal domain-containing protein [Verminephrobacter aporrectodeae subsp. tuberculatae]|uniref:hemagglutinin repeat-containing protein n=1 Tax=Verminephrobacter aporrectodeae TaxID=1110389 RepID=UPI002243E7DB|nr:hemagglutinin repeat-containing protein [Verminephrobacter aporrectodeae]MCW8196914.1 filamentous hemagglutinin N-terminal domain-containing protein [Verminephrobacter aporrectodeae subsp. tuberculatae]
MNHIYRVIWNSASATWMAVAETARGHGKGRRARVRRRGIRAFGALALIPLGTLAQVASVVVAPGSPLNAYVAPNGVTVVNTNAANTAGLSHNRYQSFNVHPIGLVLNNTTSAQIVYPSQLAGQVTANLNQAHTARVILNEVISNNRSALAGFTEVLGGRADVVLANPYGITCSGCGFINTDRVTLTTGNPFLTASGGLDSFSTGQGDILITGTGLNATAQQVLDLVTRSLRLEASIHGQDVGVAVGANRWSYDTRAVTGPAAHTGAAPVYSVDSSVLGGMYANRIRLTSTEAGVGVRLLGDAAASAGDFTLTAAGRVELQTRVTALSDVNVSTTSAEANALALTDASLTSTGKTVLDAAGGTSITGSALIAGSDLSVRTASLIDSASASGIANNNLRHAGGALTLAVGNSASLGATQWGAGGAWNGAFGHLVSTAATKLYSREGTLSASADQGDLALGWAELQSAGDMTLSSTGGIRAASGAVLKSRGGNVSLSAGNGISNAGTMTADKGKVTLRADGSIDNSGQIHAAQDLDIADRSGGASATLSNSGTLLTDGALALRAAGVSNTAHARIQAQTGSTVHAAHVDNAGAWLLSQQAGAQDALTVGRTLVNSGTLQGAGSMVVGAGSVSNSSSGTLQGAGSVLVTAGSVLNSGKTQAGGALSVVSAGAVSNAASGVLQGASLNLTAADGLLNAGIATADSGNATLRVNGTVENSGQLHARDDIDIADRSGAATQTVTNSGNLLAERALTLKASLFANTAHGRTQASRGSTAALGSFDNAGVWLLSQTADANDQLSVSGRATNSGTLQGAGKLVVSAANLLNGGAVLSAGELGVSTADDLSNTAAGTLQAGRALSVAGGGRVENAAGASLTGRSVLVRAGRSMRNAGAIDASAGTAMLRVNGTLANTGTVRASAHIDIADRNGGGAQAVTNSGTLQAEQNVELQALSVSNAATGHVQANTGSTVTSGRFDNAGTWLLSQQPNAVDRVHVRGRLTNSGVLQGAGDGDLDADQLSNSGKLITAGRLTANTTTGLDNTGATAVVQAGRQLTVKGTGAALSNGKNSKMLGDGLDIDVLSMDNAGTIQGGTRSDSKVSASGSLNNRTGGTIDVATASVGAGAVSASEMNNAGTIQSAGAMALGVGSGGLSSNGTVIAERKLTVQSRVANTHYTAAVNGLLQSRSGMLTLNGTGGSTLNVGATGTVVGQQFSAALGTVALADGATLSSDRDMTLSLDTLSLAGANAKVLGSKEQNASAGSPPWQTRITTAKALSNNGLLFSGNDLAVSAPSVTNGLSGGISALHDLSVTATTGKLMNQGTLYAGNALTASAESGTLTNAATLTAYQGRISAGTSISLGANTLVNNSTIDSNGSIAMTARTLLNEVPGGDTRVYGENSAAITKETSHNPAGYYDSFPDLSEYWYYAQTWHKDQIYSGGTPTIKPQITGARTVSLNFNTGKNLGGVISGDTVALSGTGANASFVNDDLALQRTAYTRTWTEHTRYIALGNLTYYTRRVEENSETHDVTELSNIGAGVYARQLSGSHFALSNNGSTAPVELIKKGGPKHATVRPREGGDANKGVLNPAASGTTGADRIHVTPVNTLSGRPATSFVHVNASNGIEGTSFGGTNNPLPTNPNGLYVIAKQPDAQYFVESNPLYQIGSPTPGSDYLAQRLGYNADELLRRLGDANYEAYLIKQQLIAQTGNALLASAQNASAQVQGLMDSAAGESEALGLVYGQALTPEQQSKLTHDIVWMVQTEINGQVVLAPVVYLSPQTKANITQGAVITAEMAELSLASLTNTGGTITGTQSLHVVSAGDVRNTSGTIQGGNVAIHSTQGSIVNQTTANGSGSDTRYETDFGKTASIASTGTLSLDAAQNIANTGANITAGGDASLRAGGDIHFDTIQDKRIDTRHERIADGLPTAVGKLNNQAVPIESTNNDSKQGQTQSSLATITTTTIEQVKSGLKIGGNLNATSGKNITFAGTDVKVTGNAQLDAANDIQIVARENSIISHSETKESGFGMNNSLFGTTTTTTDSTLVRNVGSQFEVGGNANLTAKNDVTVQGSRVDVKGHGQIKAGKNVNVLAGRNYEETRTVIERTGILQVSASGDAQVSTPNAGAPAPTAAGSINTTGAAAPTAAGSADTAGAAPRTALGVAVDNKVPESVNMDASANASGSAGLALYAKTKTQTQTTDLQHVGSIIRFGSDLTVDASRDINLQGSHVVAAGDAKINAQNVHLLAAEDRKTSTTQHESLSIGLMASSKNTAQAQASAEASGSAAHNTNPNAKIGLSGQVSASSENRIDVMQYSTKTDATLDTTHQGSSITAGQDLSIKAKKNLVLEGGNLFADRDVDLHAAKMEFKAVNDVHEKRSSSSETTAGFYATGTASAGGDAGAGVGLGVQASASAHAQARAEMGIQATNTRSDSVEGATFAVISGITAGRNITRTARESITDVGTGIEAGGDLTQSAKTIRSLAAANTTYSSSNSASDTTKIGLYAEATANVSAGLMASEKGASVAAGVTASHKHEDASSRSSSSQAVVSSISVGGSVRSSSTNKTELEGSTIDAKKSVSIEAGSLDYRAARNTSTSSETSTNAAGTVDISVVGPAVNINASYHGSEQRESSNQAVAGVIRAGENLSIRTKGDARYEGSKLEAGGKVDLVAGGKTSFDAATNYQESKMRNVGVDAGISVSAQGGGGNLGVQVQVAQSSRAQELGGSIKSGSGPITIQSGQDASFTGVTFDAGKNDVTIASAGNLTFKAAHDRQESLSVSASVGISASKGKNPGASRNAGLSKNYSETGAPNAALNLEKTSSDTVTGTEIHSTGKVTLAAGKNASLENVQLVGSNDLHATAGGKMEKSTVQSTSDSFGIVAYAPEIRLDGNKKKGAGADSSSSSPRGNLHFPKNNKKEGAGADSSSTPPSGNSHRPKDNQKENAGADSSSNPPPGNLPTQKDNKKEGAGADSSSSSLPGNLPTQKDNKKEGAGADSSSSPPRDDSHVSNVAKNDRKNAPDTEQAKPRSKWFNPPKILKDGRIGYLLSPTKPVAVELVGTRGGDAQPLQSTAVSNTTSPGVDAREAPRASRTDKTPAGRSAAHALEGKTPATLLNPAEERHADTGTNLASKPASARLAEESSSSSPIADRKDDGSFNRLRQADQNNEQAHTQQHPEKIHETLPRMDAREDPRPRESLEHKTPAEHTAADTLEGQAPATLLSPARHADIDTDLASTSAASTGIAENPSIANPVANQNRDDLDAYIGKNIGSFTEVAQKLQSSGVKMNSLTSKIGGSFDDRANKTIEKLTALRNDLGKKLDDAQSEENRTELIQDAKVDATKIIANGHAALESGARWSKNLTLGGSSADRKKTVEKLENIRRAEKLAYQNSNTNNQLARISREKSKILENFSANFKNNKLIAPGEGISETTGVEVHMLGRGGYTGSPSTSVGASAIDQPGPSGVFGSSIDLKLSGNYKKTTEISRSNDGNFLVAKTGQIEGNLSLGVQANVGLEKNALISPSSRHQTADDLKSADISLFASVSGRIEGGISRNIGQYSASASTPADAHGMLLLMNMLEPSITESASSKLTKDSSISDKLLPRSQLDTGDLAGVTQRRIQRGYKNEPKILKAYEDAGLGGTASSSLYGVEKPLALQFIPDADKTKPESMTLFPKILPKPSWITRDQNAKSAYWKFSAQLSGKPLIPTLSAGGDINVMQTFTRTHRTTESPKLPHNAFDPSLTGSIDQSAKYVSRYFADSKPLLYAVGRPIADALGVPVDRFLNTMAGLEKNDTSPLSLRGDAGDRVVAIHEEFANAVNSINNFAVQNDRKLKRAQLKTVRDSIGVFNKYGFTLSLIDTDLLSMNGSNRRIKHSKMDKDFQIAAATIEEAYSSFAGALKVQTRYEKDKRFDPEAPLRVVLTPDQMEGHQNPAENMARPISDATKLSHAETVNKIYAELDAERLPFHRTSLVSHSRFTRGADNSKNGLTSRTDVFSGSGGLRTANTFGLSMTTTPVVGDNFFPLFGNGKNIIGKEFQFSSQVTKTPLDYTDPGQTGTTIIKKLAVTTHTPLPDRSDGSKEIASKTARSLFTGGLEYESRSEQSKFQQYSQGEKGRKFSAYIERGIQTEQKNRAAFNIAAPVAPGVSVGGGVALSRLAKTNQFNAIAYGNDVGARAIVAKKLFKEWFTTEEIASAGDLDTATTKFQEILGSDEATRKMFLGAKGVDPISSQLSQMRNLRLDDRAGNYRPPFNADKSRNDLSEHDEVHSSKGPVRPNYVSKDQYIDKSGFFGYALTEAPENLGKEAVKTWMDKKREFSLPRATDLDRMLMQAYPEGSGSNVTTQQYLKTASSEQRLAFYRTDQGRAFVREFLTTMDFAGHLNEFIKVNNTYKYRIDESIKSYQNKLLDYPAFYTAP